MPFTRPTLPELIDTSAAELETRMPGILARVRRSLGGVLARVQAGALWGLYGYAEDLDKQKWPDLADGAYLDWHGARWGVTRKSAQQAAGSARFTGVNATPIPAATIVQRTDGVQYATQADGVIAAGVAIVAVLAVVAGNSGNALINTGLTLTSPIAGVTSVATASTALALGSDLEGDEAYRARILLRVRQVPHAGAANDYVQWALDVPGVTRAWVYPLENGLGTVVVRFVRDDDAGGFIPNAPEVASVQAYIDQRRPVTSTVTVSAPVAQAVNFNIHLSPDTADIRAAVTEELDALFRRDENEPGGTLLLSHFREAISVAVGENDHTLFTPNANVVLPAATMGTRGVITWS